ncbi:MAG TPA: hypothetical protein VFG04_30910 [Planctomycetaceae bacterium]|jgi:hypothetical protein|nr:hypothetical protein [Planctomycetaceae bacterium]
MSDEPKKRSRKWIGWTLLLALVLYPLSLGPANRLVWASEDPAANRRVFAIVYPLSIGPASRSVASLGRFDHGCSRFIFDIVYEPLIAAANRAGAHDVLSSYILFFYRWI